MCNKEIVLNCPDFIDKEYRTVSIDLCISKVIKALWKRKIVTLGCCCGHGKEQPSVIIDQSYNRLEIAKIKAIIKRVDSREWKILQWNLIDVNKLFMKCE